MNDLVSVIVPVYNVEEYVDKCMISICEQTYVNIEILLIDDGSTDTSGIKCDEWAKKDNRIKVVHKVNGGLSDARNYGLDLALGEWILFVDSDDYIDKLLIEKCLKLAWKNKAALIIFEYYEVDEYDRLTSCEKSNKECVFDSLSILNAFIKFGTGSSMACNKLYRKEIWEGLRFVKGKLHEDEFIIIDTLQRADKVYLSSEPFYFYRKRSGSIMNKKGIKSYRDKLEAYYGRKRYFINDKELLPYVNYKYLCLIIEAYLELNVSEREEFLIKYKKEYKSSIKGINIKKKCLLWCFYLSPTLYKIMLWIRLIIKEKLKRC